MEFKITKEQIEKLAITGNADTERYLQSIFPEAFKRELEIGRWYVYGRSLLNYQGLNHKDLIQAYGFLEDKSWMETSNCGNDFKSWKEAIPEEVESALIAEAKKRGYKKGQRIKSFVVGTTLIGSNNDYVWKYVAEENALSYAGAWVFKAGQWAEILPTEKTVITREKALKILAKKLKVSPENIEIV